MSGDGDAERGGLARAPARSQDDLFATRALELMDRIDAAVEMRRNGYDYNEIERWLVKEHGMSRRHARKYRRVIKGRLARDVGGDRMEAWAEAVAMARRTYRGAAEAKVTVRVAIPGENGRVDYEDQEVPRPDHKAMVAAGRWFSDLWGLHPKIALHMSTDKDSAEQFVEAFCEPAAEE